MTWSNDEIERFAQADLAATRQVRPPFRPSVILRDLLGVRIETGRPKGGSLLVGGDDPHVVIAEHIGLAKQRLHCGEEAGHCRLAHINVHALWQFAAHGGQFNSPQQEREAKHYASAVTMPAWWLADAYADGAVRLERLVDLLDVPIVDLRRRLHALDHWPLTYSLRDAGPLGFGRAYRECGWWKITRQPRYLAELAARQGRSGRLPICERPGCRKLARCVNHRHYETPGCEDDDDLEALCSDHHYDEHQSHGRIR